MALLFGLVAAVCPLGCGAASQEKTTCGLYEGWKAYQRYREQSSYPMPVVRPGIVDAVEVDVAAVACVRRRGGRVRCWEGTESWPVPGLEDATSIAVGTSGACAIRATGVVLCWYHHELAEHVRTERALQDIEWLEPGPPPLVPVELPVPPEQVCVFRPELTAGVVAGYGHGATWGCAHSPVAGALCWKIDKDDRAAPHMRVESLHQHTLTTRPARSQPADGLTCPAAWPTADQEGAARSIQAYRAGAAAARELDFDQALRLFKLAQREADFLELWAAAAAVYQQLGDSEQVEEIRRRYLACGGDPRRFDRWLSSPVRAVDVPLLKNVELEGEPEDCPFRERGRYPCDRSLPSDLAKTRFDSIARAGDGHACAIDDSGQVWCWGHNDVGQLGDGTREARATPVRVQGLSDAVSIGVGLERSCAVQRSGQVACWGVGARPHSAQLQAAEP